MAAVWMVFRKKGFNFIETFFAMVYISCQMQLLTLAWILLTRNFTERSIFPYGLPEIFVFILLCFDFRQLYGVSVWGSFWRTILVCALLVLLYISLLALVMIPLLTVEILIH